MEQLLSNTGAAFLSGLFLYIMTALGSSLFKAVKFNFDDGAENFMFSFSAGVIVFSLLILAAGKLGFYTKPVFLGITSIVVLLSIPGMKKAASAFKSAITAIGSVKGWLLIISLIIFLPRFISSAFGMFLPLTGYDTMAYHYALPAMYLSKGQVFCVPFMYHANWPQHMEIIFGWAMGVYNDIFANGVSYAYTLALLAAVYAVAAKISGPGAGLLAAALMGSFYVFKVESSNGYVDIGTAFFETAAVYGAYMYYKTGDKKFIFASAACAGGAASVKILGVFSAVFLPFFIILSGGGKKLRFKEAIIFALMAGLIASPWYIKSWIDTGNPVWPFAYKIFGGKYWSQELSDFRSVYYSGKGGGKDLLGLLTLPFSMVLSKKIDGYMGNNMIVFYLLLPFIIYSAAVKKEKAKGFFLIYTAVFTMFWYFSAKMVRFYLPGLAVIAALTAAEAVKLMEGKNRVWKYAAFAMMVFLLTYGFPRDLSRFILFSGAEKRDAYLDKNLDCYKLYEKINKDSSIDGRIVLFKEVRGYYLKKDYMWGDPVNQGLISYKSADATLKDLKNNGVKYVLYNNNNFNVAYNDDGYTPLTFSIMKEIAEKKCDLLYCENRVCLYKIRN